MCSRLVVQIWLGLMFGLLWAGAGLAQLEHGDPAVRVVGYDWVNARTEPQVNDETFITRVSRGTLLKRLDQRDGWYQVVLPDGQKAWIHGRYAEEVVARDLLEVIKGEVNVRSSSTTASRVVAAVKQGDMLSLVRERNGWYDTVLPDGKRGWIRSDMVALRPLAPPEPPPPADAASSEVAPEPSEEPAEPPQTGDPHKRARELLEEGRIDEALAAFREALEAEPDNGGIHFELAKVLKDQGQTEDALVHFRRAQRNGRDEAKFYIDELLNPQADSVAVAQKPAPVDPAAETGFVDEIWERAALFLPALALGSVVFLGMLGFVIWRRRRGLQPDKPVYRRRNQDAGFDAALKYAVEKRPLLRAIEESERKRADLDEALQQRLVAFEGGEPDGRPLLPAGESSEVLLQRVEDLRKVILNQEERAQIYADLIVLQNEKLAALDEEIDALKKLIRIDAQDGGKKPDPGSGSGG